MHLLTAEVYLSHSTLGAQPPLTCISLTREYWYSLCGLIHTEPNYSGKGSTIRKSQDAGKTVVAWRQLISAVVELPGADSTPAGAMGAASNGPLMIDLVEATRSVLSNLFVDLYTLHFSHYQEYLRHAAGTVRGVDSTSGHSPRKLEVAMLTLGKMMLGVISDLESVLASNENFLLASQIAKARGMASTPEEADQFEYNARNLVTLWGPAGEINDYGSRSWAGVVGSYYLERWQLMLDTLQSIVREKVPPEQVGSILANCSSTMLTLGKRFCRSKEPLPVGAVGRTVEIVRSLKTKYSDVKTGFKLLGGMTARGEPLVHSSWSVHGHDYGHNGEAGALWSRHAGALSLMCSADPLCAGFSTNGVMYRSVSSLVSYESSDLYLKVSVSRKSEDS
jgi:hypothetical protein